MAKKLFITGTGTDVGKTFVTGLLLKKLRESGAGAAYYKAAMSGNERDAGGALLPGDALAVKAVSGICQSTDTMCPFVYEHAVSPHLASRLEGNPVELSRVVRGFESLCRQYDYVTMEGSGGILCPLCEGPAPLQLEQVIDALGLCCLIVADAGLGALNAVGLTAAYMKEKKIPVVGIILNRFRPGDLLCQDNLEMCRRMTGLEVVACVKEGDTDLPLCADALKALYR